MKTPRLILAPVERLKERYSDQWFRWIRRDLRAAHVAYAIAGGKRQARIRTGEFLDVFDTNVYKATQAADLIRQLRRATAPVTVLYLDGWNPTVEMVAYVRSCAKVDVKIVGLFHAGTYDPHDFLAQMNCDRWAQLIERAWLGRIYDRVLVATEYHARLIASTFGDIPRGVLRIVPFPVYTNSRLLGMKKRDIVVFPHRLAPEKQPEQFAALQSAYESRYGRTSAAWIRTKDVCRSKRDYYRTLACCKVAFSAALQETFGIAMLEAENMGCIPVAPRRLSYLETLDRWPLYLDLPEAVEMVRRALINYSRPTPRYTSSMRPILQETL